MRVLHYVDENRLAWGETWIQLLKELARQGVENHVVCKSGGTLAGRLAEEGISFDTYDVPVAWLPWTARGLGKIIDYVKPDVIHTRLSSAARIGGWWGRRANIPVLSTIDKYAKGYYYKNASFLIPCSNAVRENMLKLGFANDIMHVIFNPIAVSRYARNEKIRMEQRMQKGISEKEMVILAAGRFDKGKGFEFAIEAYAICLQETPHLRGITSLHIVGDGAEREKYLALIAQCKVEDKVFLHPFAQDIRPWLWAADFFVQPSYRPEGFSLMLLETMAAGTPAIATNIGGALDIINDGDNGWLCPPRDARSLASKIIAVVNNRCTLERVAKNSMLTALHYDIQSITTEVIALYNRFI